ncbi:MAG: CYTH domain-containing protein [Erysipelotrichaceae bacterium]|nr:CYTH domain-containing protein [Erysipelotrichaceae bacterium]
MHTNHEIEFKTFVDPQKFQQLCNAYPNAIIHNQTNVYYESATVNLKEMGFAMRIRNIDGKHLFTMKQKASQGHQEYEIYLDENSPSALNHPDLLKLFQQFNITGPFVIMGQLHTIRRSIQLNYGELCLDENEYCGIKDYEIEFEIDVEHIQEAEQEFKQLMDTYQIPLRPSKPKRTRCLAQMNKENTI